MSAFLDTEQFSELRELMADDLDTLIAAYLRDSSDRIAQIEAALASGDFATIRRQAHSLKGSSSNVGAGNLAKHCALLEQFASGESRVELATQWLVLRQELAGVQQALQQQLV